ncbi:MAG: hypothetical protein QOJ75_1087, partial [Chloroflexota bacterium]|nr:hypothetical protein [Chloroflexota bacterium]
PLRDRRGRSLRAARTAEAPTREAMPPDKARAAHLRVF